MTTELVWSTVKPTFEEVEGKVILWMGEGWVFPGANRIDNIKEYEYIFDRVDFTHYTILDLADLTAPVSPLPLWGKLPEINCVKTMVFDIPMHYFAKYNHIDGFSCELPYCDTRELAILAWNRIAEALNEVER